MTAERITAPLVQRELEDHLKRHELKIDPKLHDVYHAVFGEQGKGGLCEAMEKAKTSMVTIDTRLEKIEGGINKVLWVVVLAVVAALLKLVIIG